jgi:hypothetical protein
MSRRRRPFDEGILAARLQGAAIRLIYSGAAEADAVAELIQITQGRVQLLTAGAELWRRSAENPMTAHGPAATAAADVLDAAARQAGHTPPSPQTHHAQEPGIRADPTC